MGVPPIILFIEAQTQARCDEGVDAPLGLLWDQFSLDPPAPNTACLLCSSYRWLKDLYSNLHLIRVPLCSQSLKSSPGSWILWDLIPDNISLPASLIISSSLAHPH